MAYKKGWNLPIIIIVVVVVVVVSSSSSSMEPSLERYAESNKTKSSIQGVKLLDKICEGQFIIVKANQFPWQKTGFRVTNGRAQDRIDTFPQNLSQT